MAAVDAGETAMCWASHAAGICMVVVAPAAGTTGVTGATGGSEAIYYAEGSAAAAATVAGATTGGTAATTGVLATIAAGMVAMFACSDVLTASMAD